MINNNQELLVWGIKNCNRFNKWTQIFAIYGYKSAYIYAPTDTTMVYEIYIKTHMNYEHQNLNNKFETNEDYRSDIDQPIKIINTQFFFFARYKQKFVIRNI